MISEVELAHQKAGCDRQHNDWLQCTDRGGVHNGGGLHRGKEQDNIDAERDPASCGMFENPQRGLVAAKPYHEKDR